ncbi:protein-L-isoaspartate O-methyltransferase [Albirhodobacter sp. R86504]|jgi:protein-L-isoaspartate(D-aspartate) O-methyltransferase|uniref:protein-L-isoaspartate O-methyltransferase family protein n=1 Tax=Albirhodobacter sp. R86504 TaxID=3093848 RepID=UPI00366F8144
MQDFAARRTMMVDTQVRPNDVTKFPIIDAMLGVPREAFVPAGKIEAAYVGENLDLGAGRVLLEPRTFAKMLDALNVQPGDLVLDIAGGLGYSSAVIARMAEAVVLLETDDFSTQAEAILSAQGVDNAAVISTEDLSAGASKHGPYDAIIVQGGVESFPSALLDQLKEGGRVVALFQVGALGTVRMGRKLDGHVAWRDLFNAAAPTVVGFAAERAFAL